MQTKCCYYLLSHMLILLHNPVLLHWIQGFSRNIGTTTSMLAEIWALRDGQNLCISMDLEAVEIEVNAKAIVDLISNDNSSNWFIYSLIDDCRILASQIPHN